FRFLEAQAPQIGQPNDLAHERGQHRCGHYAIAEIMLAGYLPGQSKMERVDWQRRRLRTELRRSRLSKNEIRQSRIDLPPARRPILNYNLAQFGSFNLVNPLIFNHLSNLHRGSQGCHHLAELRVAQEPGRAEKVTAAGRVGFDLKGSSEPRESLDQLRSH